MKVLVIAQPRTRAMWFINCLSSHLSLKNLDSPYGINNSSIEQLNRFNEKIKNEDDFVIKIETTDLYFDEIWYGLEPFNVQQYDKIYCLHRSKLVDLMCSFYLAEKLNVWHFWRDVPELKGRLDINNEYKRIRNHVISNGPYIIDPEKDKNFLKQIKKLIDSYEYVIKWLEEKKIDYTTLEYDDVPKYVNNNLPNSYSNIIEGNLNYRELFENYDDLESFL